MKKAFAILFALIMLVSLAACGGGGGEDDGIVGSYTLYSATMEGTDYTLEELRSMDIADGTYLIFNADGTGELTFAGEEPDKITYDEGKKEITLTEGGFTYGFTVDDGKITVDLEDMIFTFEPGAVSVGGTAGGSAYVPSDFFNDVTVAANFGDAFVFAGPVNWFVGVPDETLTGEWYGWMQRSNSWGDNIDMPLDVWAVIDYDSTYNRKFIEVFEDGDNIDPILSMWLEDEPADRLVIPDIGDADAWIFNCYLTPEDESDFETSIAADGSLHFGYTYEDPDGTGGCDVEIFMRKVGAQWNEDGDTLPFRYDDYTVNMTNPLN